jgi:alpha-glucosidase
MFWRFPADSAAWNSRWEHQFLVGDHLLVAPVVHEGQRHQEVRLPAGRWADLATGRVHDGDRVAVLDAPLDRIPMLLGEGGILPTGQPMDYVGATHDPALTLDVLAGPRPGRFTLYEDDGLSWDFEDGGYRTTRFEVSQRPGRQAPELRLTRLVVHDGFQVPGRPLTVRFFGRDERPGVVTLDGRDVPERPPSGAANPPAAGTTWWAYDRERGVVSVRFAEEGEQQELRVR